jgi:hypothetical protein
MLAKKLFPHKKKTTCLPIFFIQTLFKTRVILKKETKKTMKIWWTKPNLKTANLQTELSLVCLKPQAPNWLKTIDFKFYKAGLELILLKKFIECPRHLTNLDKLTGIWTKNAIENWPIILRINLDKLSLVKLRILKINLKENSSVKKVWYKWWAKHS